MALGPINYQMQVATPFESVLQGMSAGAKMADIEAARMQRLAQAAAAQQAATLAQAKFDREQAFETAKQSYFANPARTGADFDRLLAQAPDKQALDALKAAGESAGAERIGNAKRFFGQLLSAIEVDPNIAKQIVDERIAGEQDPNSKRGMEVIRKALEISPEFALEQVELLGGAGLGKEWIDSVAEVRKARQARKLAPLEEAIKRAQAGKEGFEATKSGYEAGIKYLELQYAPGKLADEVAKRAADLKLTGAQTQQAVAAANASAAAARKSGAEAEAAQAAAKQATAGIIPADKRPEAESKLRKEYNDNTKGFTEVRSAFDRVNASQDNAVGDLSLIFGYMKMLDPGSVVREGEFATAQNAAGVPDRVLNLYNRVLSGERLNKSQREAFKGQASQLMTAAQKQEQIVRDGITRIAGGMGLNTSNIFYEAAIPAQSAAIPGAPVQPGQNPPAGPRPALPASPYGGLSNDEILRRLAMPPGSR
jgi:hypothetical protein